MPEVIIYVTEGRTVEQKRGLVRDITDAFTRNFQTPPENMIIQFVECSEESKAKNGQLFIDRK